MIEFYEEKNGFGEWQRIYNTDGKRVYRFPELRSKDIQYAIKKAQEMWTKASGEWIKKNGDQGSCIIGDGLAIAVKPPKARNVYQLLIARPLGQGDFAGYHTKDPVMEYLKANGIDCWYECGRMD